MKRLMLSFNSLRAKFGLPRRSVWGDTRCNRRFAAIDSSRPPTQPTYRCITNLDLQCIWLCYNVSLSFAHFPEVPGVLRWGRHLTMLTNESHVRTPSWPKRWCSLMLIDWFIPKIHVRIKFFHSSAIKAIDFNCEHCSLIPTIASMVEAALLTEKVGYKAFLTLR